MTGQYIIGAEGLLKNLTDGNMGAVRYSVDGTKMLLENYPEKFEDVVANNPTVLTFTHEEVLAYLQDNYDEWHEPFDEQV